MLDKLRPSQSGRLNILSLREVAVRPSVTADCRDGHLKTGMVSAQEGEREISALELELIPALGLSVSGLE